MLLERKSLLGLLLSLLLVLPSLLCASFRFPNAAAVPAQLGALGMLDTSLTLPGQLKTTSHEAGKQVERDDCEYSPVAEMQTTSISTTSALVMLAEVDDIMKLRVGDWGWELRETELWRAYGFF